MTGLFDRWADGVAPTLAPPGRGATAERFAALGALARIDVAAARLGEAHADARAILEEAGCPPDPRARYGVWASDGPGSRLDARPDGDAWCLRGAKRYCSGASLLTHALVTAHAPDGVRLFAVDLSAVEVRDDDPWVAPAFASTATKTVAFTDVVVAADRAIGAPGWYLDRPGFWHGAVGVAACWAGGAQGVADAAEAVRHGDDPHADAHRGALRATAWLLDATLATAAAEIDAGPLDVDAAHRRALAVRHVVEQAAQEVVVRFGRLAGPGPLAFDADVARRLAEVQLYVRQSHAERDLAELGRA